MKKSKFTEQQIAFALQQVETGTKVKDVVRKLGITEQTFYRWKRKFGGLGPSDLRKLRLLEEENRKLKQVVADLSLDKAMLQEVIGKNSEGRSEEPTRSLPAGQLSGQRTSSMQSSSAGPFELSSQVRAQGPCRLATEDSGARRSTGSLRLPSHPHPASTRRL
jgi:putative transposase